MWALQLCQQEKSFLPIAFVTGVLVACDHPCSHHSPLPLVSWEIHWTIAAQLDMHRGSSNRHPIKNSTQFMYQQVPPSQSRLKSPQAFGYSQSKSVEETQSQTICCGWISFNPVKHISILPSGWWVTRISMKNVHIAKWWNNATYYNYMAIIQYFMRAISQ